MSSWWYRIAGFAMVPVVVAAIAWGCSSSGGGGGGFNQVQPPAGLTITSVFPNVGALAGGTQVNVTGTGFAAGATVTFGAAAATNVQVQSANTIVCNSPPGAAGFVDVIVTVGQNTARLANAFQYSATAPPPGGGGGGGGGTTMTFASITPNSGSQNGGTVVQIQGTNFQNITQVTLGGTALTGLQVPSSTLITGTTAAHAAGAVPLSIFSSSNGTLTVANAFTYTLGSSSGTGAMTVTNVTPNNGPLAGGTAIRIDGTNFLPTISVSIAGVPCTNIVVTGTTQIDCITPAAPMGFGGGPVNLTVASTDPTAGQVSFGLGFTYNGAGGLPTLTQVTPNSAPESGGTKITILGTNFLSGTLTNISQVLVGGKTLLNLTVVNGTTLTGTVPLGVAGSTTVTAFNTNGQPSNSLPFTLTPSLFFTGMNPNQGPTAGGTSVTLKGRNFSVGNIGSVTFTNTLGSVDAVTINVIDSNTLTAIVPAAPSLADGPTTVTINGVGIASASFQKGYTYGPLFNPPSNVTEAVAMVNSPIAMAVGRFIQARETVGCTVFSNNQVRVMPNGVGGIGGATFTNAQLPGAPADGLTNVDVALADMDADGTLDSVLLRSDGVNTNRVKVLLTRLGNPVTLQEPAGQPAGGYPVAGTGVATSLAIAFVNSDDTFYDVAVTVRGGTGDRLEFLKGGNGGTLAAGPTAVNFPPGSQPSRVVCADPSDTTTDPRQFREGQLAGQDQKDMTKDGNTDFVVARAGDDMVSIVRNDGAAVWSGTISSTAYVGTGARAPSSLALADLNCDGTLDVVCGNKGVAGVTPANFTVFLGNGAGAIAFVATNQVLGPGQIETLTVGIGDYNYDCRPDVITGPFNNHNFTIFLGHGDGTYSDGINYDGQIASKRNNSRIVAAFPVLTSTTFTGVMCLDANATAADFTVTFVPKHLVTPFTGEPQAPPFYTANVQQDPQSVAVGDLNGDGRNDVIVANRAAASLQVFIGDGMGNFTTPISPIGTGREPESIFVVDVNRDGRLDVVVACSGSDAVFVHRNLGNGQLAAGQQILVNARGPHQVVSVDMNGDKRRDLVTCNQFGNSVTILLGDGTGNFTPPVSGWTTPVPGVYPVGNSPRGIIVRDLNGDDRPDIAAANSSDDSVTVLLRVAGANNSDIPFANGTDYPLSGIIPAQAGPPTASVSLGKREPVSIATGDVNGDGLADLVVAEKFSSTVMILHNDAGAAGTFFFPTRSDPAQDFCPGLGLPLQPTIYYHYGTNIKIGMPQIIYPVGTNPMHVQLFDMDLDGRLDIVTVSFDGKITTYLNGGSAGQRPTVTAAGLQPVCPAVGGNSPYPPLPAFNMSPTGETNFGCLVPANRQTGVFTIGTPYTTQVGAAATFHAVGKLLCDCPPSVCVEATDNMHRVFQVK